VVRFLPGEPSHAQSVAGNRLTSKPKTICSAASPAGFEPGEIASRLAVCGPDWQRHRQTPPRTLQTGRSELAFAADHSREG
jgi:hypothetical protein